VGGTRFWGLVVIVSDLDALAERFGDLLSEIRPAVQPGRRIAPLRSKAGLGPAVAFLAPS
jgi:sensor domain CHASE-containing protein